MINSKISVSLLRTILLSTLIAVGVYEDISAQETLTTEKILDFEMFDEREKGFGDIKILYISTDNDDSNAEIVRYVKNLKEQYGITNPIITYYTNICDIDALLILQKVYEKTNRTEYEYYVSGQGSFVERREGESPKVKKSDNMEIGISPEMYKYLEALLGNQVEYKTITKSVKYDDEYDDDYDYLEEGLKWLLGE